MAKDPAFLFYSQDFFTGVATMSFEDRGKYITILCLMHQKGRLSEETIRFLVGSFSVTLKSKFKVDEDGFFYNERLEVETEKRNKFTESRRGNGSLGGRPKKTDNLHKTDRFPVGLAKDNLMGNENENNNSSLKKVSTSNQFPTMPLYEDVETLPEIQIKKVIERVRISVGPMITKETVLSMWDIFKHTNLTGHNFYPNLPKVYSHFENWMKGQKFTAAGGTQEKGMVI